MSVSSEGQGRKQGYPLLWGLVFIIPAAAVVGNYLLNDVIAAVRAPGVVVVIAAAGAVALQAPPRARQHWRLPVSLAWKSARSYGRPGKPFRQP